MGTFARCIACAGIVAIVLVQTAQAVDGVDSRQVKASFDDVYFDLKNAIVDQGLVIDSTSHVADMLNRTGADVGSAKPIFLQGKTLSFCSAKLSRAAMEADPENLAFCPYTVFIYETEATPGVTTIGYRKLAGASSPQSQQTLDAVNELLSKILNSVGGN